MVFIFTKGGFMVLFSYVNGLHQNRKARNEKERQSFKDNEKRLDLGPRGSKEVWRQCANLFFFRALNRVERRKIPCSHAGDKAGNSLPQGTWQSLPASGHGNANLGFGKRTVHSSGNQRIEKGGNTTLPP